MKKIILPLILALILFLTGCEVNVLSPPPPPPPPPPAPATITIGYEWWLDGTMYYLDLTIFEDDYQTARHTPRIPHEEYYGELVSYALGPGYVEAGDIADGVYELAWQSCRGCDLLPLAMSYLQETSPSADFDVSLPFHYPLESLVTGGRNSGDMATLGAALLENLGYATGIAIFWDTYYNSVHVALAITDPDWAPHDYDNLGTGWTFLEPTASGDYRPIGARPSWFTSYDAWVVWPLWETIQSAPEPRKGGKAKEGATLAIPDV